MKIFQKILILLLVFSMAFAVTDNREFRATWSITWHQFAAGLTVNQLQARTRNILDKHVEAGMNAVIWQVRQAGTAYYPSAYEPWGSYLGHTDPGYDPLAYAIEEAHKRGLELHAWFNTFATASTVAGTPAAEHPDWVCRDGYGNVMTANRCLSPGLKAVRDYTIAMIMEIVENYDVDGIHLDYVRWNEYSSTSTSVAFAEIAEEELLLDGMLPPGMEAYLEQQFNEKKWLYTYPFESDRSETGNQGALFAPAAPLSDSRYLYDIEHPLSGGIPDSTDLYPDATPGVKFASWGDWRRGATNVFVEALHDTIQKTKPWVKVSPAALGRHRAASWNGYFTVFQDAARWLNEGWIDIIMAMSYHWLTGSAMYNQLMTDWGPYLGPAISEGRPYSVGPASYLINGWDPHRSIVMRSREISWVKGFQFFSYGNWSSSSYPEESSNSIFAFKTKHPSYAFLDNTVPAEPSVSLTKNSDLSYTVTVTPDPGVSEKQWFAIYQSKDATIDVNSDEILELVYADSAFSYTVTYDGLQKNNDKYYYAATMCSRYWVESLPSNVVVTDVLPAVVPTVVQHVPADGAINVPNNQIVHIEFNKSMDPESISEHLSVSPDVTNLSLSWENPNWVKNDHLILYVSASWDFDTQYTLTLAGATSDQIGMQIDGDGDGTGGDAYSFSFTVSGADETPPEVTHTIPADEDMFIDVDAPVSLAFNELLNISSLEDKFTFRFNGSVVSPVYRAFNDAENKTHVNIKAGTYLGSNAHVTLEVAPGISDTTGNAMDGFSLSFTTDSTYYVEQTIIDNFTGTYAWERPGFSGSTTGIVDEESSTTLQTVNYVAGLGDNRAMRIIVKPSSETWFARIYSAAHRNAATGLDTNKVMQAYVFGDGSGYEFRISVAEAGAPAGNSFEVSQWYPVDWVGWKLVEWDMKDPAQLGEWGGMTNGKLDGTKYTLESIQLRPGSENPLQTVTFYIDQIRMADKQEGLPEPNNPPVIQAIPDTTVMSDVEINIYASYSDPDPGDKLTLRAFPDTSAVVATVFTSQPGRIRLRSVPGYMGVSRIMVTVTDNGIGELSDTTYFNLTVTHNTSVAGIPEAFKVYPNYPNPFNPATTLRFDLPASEHIRIEIFNTKGQRVAVLADRHFEAGSHRLSFDGNAFVSGVYFYKISAGSLFHVERMTLIK